MRTRVNHSSRCLGEDVRHRRRSTVLKNLARYFGRNAPQTASSKRALQEKLQGKHEGERHLRTIRTKPCLRPSRVSQTGIQCSQENAIHSARAQGLRPVLAHWRQPSTLFDRGLHCPRSTLCSITSSKCHAGRWTGWRAQGRRPCHQRWRNRRDWCHLRSSQGNH